MKSKKIKAVIVALACAFTFVSSAAFTGCENLDAILNNFIGDGGDNYDDGVNDTDGSTENNNVDSADENDDGGADGTDENDGGETGSTEGSDGDENGNDSGISEGELTEITSADLSIHFLELGNKYAGDSILIKCGDTEVLIDAGSRASSITTLKSYIDEYCTDGVLEYVIATHSDQDHIEGFCGSSSSSTVTGIFSIYEIQTLIRYDVRSNSSKLATKFETAVESLAEDGTTVYTASQCYDQTDGAQRQYYLDENQTISINILYNYYYYNQSSDNNNHSVVTLLTQETEDGNLNYLFTGDLEAEGEEKLVEYYSDVPSDYQTDNNVLPKVQLYKAGHHGSKTSSSAALLEVIQPEYVAVCCCAGSPEYTTNNENTFPTQVMIDNVSKYTDKIYVTSLAVIEDFENKKYDYTSMNGNIVFYYNEGLKLYCSNNTTILKDTEWFKENRTWNG